MKDGRTGRHWNFTDCPRCGKKGVYRKPVRDYQRHEEHHVEQCRYCNYFKYLGED